MPGVRVPVALLALSSAMPSFAQDAEVSSRYTMLDNCSETANGNDAGQDWIAYRCVGLGDIPVWLAYADSSRSSLGFGPRENRSGIFGLDRDGAWPVEWRGVERRGGFVPFAVILRMETPAAGGEENPQGLLYVFRLREDGVSCIVASQLSSNLAARAAADGTQDGYRCLFEPHMP